MENLAASGSERSDKAQGRRLKITLRESKNITTTTHTKQKAPKNLTKQRDFENNPQKKHIRGFRILVQVVAFSVCVHSCIRYITNFSVEGYNIQKSHHKCRFFAKALQKGKTENIPVSKAGSSGPRTAIQESVSTYNKRGGLFGLSSFSISLSNSRRP